MAESLYDCQHVSGWQSNICLVGREDRLFPNQEDSASNLKKYFIDFKASEAHKLASDFLKAYQSLADLFTEINTDQESWEEYVQNIKKGLFEFIAEALKLSKVWDFLLPSGLCKLLGLQSISNHAAVIEKAVKNHQDLFPVLERPMVNVIHFQKVRQGIIGDNEALRYFGLVNRLILDEMFSSSMKQTREKLASFNVRPLQNLISKSLDTLTLLILQHSLGVFCTVSVSGRFMMHSFLKSDSALIGIVDEAGQVTEVETLVLMARRGLKKLTSLEILNNCSRLYTPHY